MNAPSSDRRSISTQRVWLLTALVGAQLWAALSSLPVGPGGRSLAAEGAALVAVMAMFGLRSVPIRWIVRAAALASGLLLARFGELSALGGVGGSWRVLLWLGATAAALSLAPSSRAVPGRTPGIVVRADGAPTSSVPVALVVAAVALIGASSLLVGPRASNAFPVGSRSGEAIEVGDDRQDNALVARSTLDMTQRPRLSEEVVMSVRSPIASFWRAETFDEWDGSRWTRSTGTDAQVLIDGEVVAPPDDLAAERGEPTRQEFRIEIGFATAVPTAVSAVSVQSEQDLAQRPDATLLSAAQPMGPDTIYTVQSRQIPTDSDQLRATDPADVPRAVRERYAAPPVATGRTQRLAERITAGMVNDYDKVRAIERWMDDNTEYSLDAPLSPQGVDVVDDFLFESQLGWCEQIASSLVVMARSAGVPARLATGFTPGEWDAAGGRFVVRERDAHAWAEVWFPEFGWVTFDPTAQVPLAGTAESAPGAAAIDWREVAGAILAVVGLAALVAGPVRWVLRRHASRRAEVRRHRALARRDWDVAEEDRIEQVGRQAGRPRGPSETISVYAGVVAATVGDDEIAERGRSIDEHRYRGGSN